MRITLGVVLLLALFVSAAEPAALEQPLNNWVKRSPVKDGPASPGLGYEASLAWDPQAKRVIRWAGHTQSGGHEQINELWTYDPLTGQWKLMEPNLSPPGVCCAQQNIFDPVQGRFLRFPGFSGNHGWHWFRENYLNNSSLWNYDLAKNTWRDMRPIPGPRPAALRCAAWDSDHQVAVLFGGEGSSEGTLVYDPYTNTWTSMNPKVQPAFRSGGNLAYDAANKRHILFGSQFNDDTHTWAYDLVRNEWTDRKPAVQPPTDRNDAVLTWDAASKTTVAVVRVADKMEKNEVVQGHVETWSYDYAANTWTQQKPAREVDGWHNRRRIITALPELNLLLLENYANPSDRIPGVDREQQMWTYRLAEAKADPRPAAPTGVQVATTGNSVSLEWQPAAGAAEYVVLRGEGAKPWQAEWRPVGRSEKTAWQDKEVKPGVIYYYSVRAVDGQKRESVDSVKVRTQPRVVEDAVVSVLSPTEVRLSWTAPGRDVEGYHVERAVVEVFSDDQVVRLKKDTPPLAEPSVGAIKAIGAFARLTQEPVKETSFTDAKVDLAKKQEVDGKPIHEHRFRKDQLDPEGKGYRYAVFAYRIRAVNALGVESGASPYFLTLPSAPQWLFSKEEGERCHLKWAANPEQKLKGYRVYRMDSPRVNGPGQPVRRLTAEPIDAAKYSDDQAGKDEKRYWIVAVDALGQEGLPSAPTWHNRVQRRHYAPFIGEWHQ